MKRPKKIRKSDAKFQISEKNRKSKANLKKSQNLDIWKNMKGPKIKFENPEKKILKS